MNRSLQVFASCVVAIQLAALVFIAALPSVITGYRTERRVPIVEVDESDVHIESGVGSNFTQTFTVGSSSPVLLTYPGIDPTSIRCVMTTSAPTYLVTGASGAVANGEGPFCFSTSSPCAGGSSVPIPAGTAYLRTSSGTQVAQCSFVDVAASGVFAASSAPSAAAPTPDPACELTGGVDCVMSGVINAAVGTVTAPSVTRNGDSDTGVWWSSTAGTMGVVADGNGPTLRVRSAGSSTLGTNEAGVGGQFFVAANAYRFTVTGGQTPAAATYQVTSDGATGVATSANGCSVTVGAPSNPAVSIGSGCNRGVAVNFSTSATVPALYSASSTTSGINFPSSNVTAVSSSGNAVLSIGGASGERAIRGANQNAATTTALFQLPRSVGTVATTAAPTCDVNNVGSLIYVEKADEVGKPGRWGFCTGAWDTTASAKVYAWRCFGWSGAGGADFVSAACGF